MINWLHIFFHVQQGFVESFEIIDKEGRCNLEIIQKEIHEEAKLYK